MHPNGEFYFHKGHYLENNSMDSLRTVENEEYSKIQCKDEDAVDYVYTDAELFLHSSCNLFALALHEEFEYNVYEIRDNQDIMAHIFCMAIYRGQVVYIDIRGVTTDIVECVSEFRNFLHNGYYIVARNIEEDKCLDNEGDKTGYQFAQSIIKKYRRYYDTSM